MSEITPLPTASNTQGSAFFAVVIDGEVASVLTFATSIKINDTETASPFEPIIAALSSNPSVVRKSEIFNFPDKGPMVMFEFYVDNEIASTVGYRSDALDSEAIIASLSSDPTIVPVDSSLGVSSGWTWDGTNFTAPQ